MNDKIVKFDTHSTNPADWHSAWTEVPIPKEDWLEGDWSAGRIAWLRFDDSRDAGNDRPLQYSVHRTDETVSIRVQIHADEFIYVIEGAFDIELDSGEKYTFNAGDAVHFRPGLKGVWTYHAPFLQTVAIAFEHAVPERTEVHSR